MKSTFWKFKDYSFKCKISYVFFLTNMNLQLSLAKSMNIACFVFELFVLVFKTFIYVVI